MLFYGGHRLGERESLVVHTRFGIGVCGNGRVKFNFIDDPVLDRDVAYSFL